MNEQFIVKGGYAGPDPVDLAAKAAVVAPEPRYRPLYDYGAAIHSLRLKGFTWSAIAMFFRDHGMSYTESHFSQAYDKWLIKNRSVGKA